MAIYFKGGDKATSIKDLLDKGFSVDQYGWYKFLSTYKTNEFLVQECHVARRSYYDLFEICKTYFPDTTEEDFLDTLLSMHVGGILTCVFCYDIKKVVWFKHPNYLMGNYEKNTTGIDDLSYNDIITKECLNKNK